MLGSQAGYLWGLQCSLAKEWVEQLLP
ncbi:MAG: hypothetical protein RL552_436, partial [Actinomycetota bacterium]